ncbi:hypothetical protein AAF712_009856 [Marasmius tenuissimus]|uniref:VIT domain-containing protein n=1 Tax=Marasmius tenuissimus TaxID=585030 RepID=A0ABR2ZQI1_9AGAR
MTPPSGIVHNSGVPGTHAYLPVQEVRADVLIIDVSARVTLTQVFSNSSSHPTSRAVYYFPVPADAAICAFEMSLGNGRVIRATCKEKTQAREDFEAALLQGKQASMLEWVTDDGLSVCVHHEHYPHAHTFFTCIVFTISVGSIPAHETIKTKLVYVMNLLNQDVDEVRFQLPSYVDERYGELPQQLVGASSSSSSTRLRITVDVQTSGTIRSIFSPTHGESLTITPYSTHLNRPSRRRSTIKFRSRDYLERDFVLIIHADKLDAPRCFAELDGDPRQKATLALQFTFVPKYNLPPIQSQEYIFVIDRSGSMQGARIEQAKRTLAMLIRMLPTERTTFNVFSFGHDCHEMWARSGNYTQTTLDYATTHIEAMEANLGGTKIENALKVAIASVWDDDDMANRIVSSASAAASPPKCAKTSPEPVTASAYSQSKQKTSSSAASDSSQPVEPPRQRRLHRLGSPIQLPLHLEFLFFLRQLLHHPRSDGTHPTTSSPSTSSEQNRRFHPCWNEDRDFRDYNPQESDCTQGSHSPRSPRRIPQPYEITVPIRGVQLKDSEPRLPTLIHILAASRLIDEHDKSRAPLPSPIDLLPVAPDARQLRRAAIVRLGERYQLASQFTSFVAVDRGQDDRRLQSRLNFGDWQGQGGNNDSDALGLGLQVEPSGVVEAASEVETEAEARLGASSPISSSIDGEPWMDVTTQDVISPISPSAAVPGAWPALASSMSSSVKDEGYESDKTFTTISSLESYSSHWTEWSDDEEPGPRRPLTEEEKRMQRAPSPLLAPRKLAPEDVRRRLPAQQPAAHRPNNNNNTYQDLSRRPIPHEIFDIATLQLYDGAYPLNDKLRALVGRSATDELGKITPKVNETVWATALAVAFITNRLVHRKELSNDITLKSREFLKRVEGSEELVRRARGMIR